MLWMHTAELLVLLLTVAILMWDNKAAQEQEPVRIRVKDSRPKKTPY